MKKILIAIAIGLVLAIIGFTFNVAVAKADDCMTASDTESWGFFPFTQYITDRTHFCWGWVDGKKSITYRSTDVSQSVDNTGGQCTENGTKSWLIGKNYFYREWTDEGDFTCPTDIMYVMLHPSDKFNVWINADGNYCGPTTRIGEECTG